MTHRVLLMIRPEKPARDFVQALEAAFGKPLNAFYSPLICIDPLPSDFSLKGITLLLFTSVNGVEQYASRSTIRDIPAFCVGKTTQKAAIAIGLQAKRADGTAQHLLAATLKACDPETSNVLYVSGAEVSFDLISALHSGGIRASQAALYRQTALPLSAKALAMLAENPAIVPVFSANSAKLLLNALKETGPTDLEVLCISPNVARFFAGTIVSKIHTAIAPSRSGMINALCELM